MTKKQLKELEKSAHVALPNLLNDMTAVLTKHGVQGMRVFSFEMEPDLPVIAPVNISLNNNKPIAGCIILPNGKIFCG